MGEIKISDLPKYVGFVLDDEEQKRLDEGDPVSRALLFSTFGTYILPPSDKFPENPRRGDMFRYDGDLSVEDSIDRVVIFDGEQWCRRFCEDEEKGDEIIDLPLFDGIILTEEEEQALGREEEVKTILLGRRVLSPSSEFPEGPERGACFVYTGPSKEIENKLVIFDGEKWCKIKPWKKKRKK